MNLTVSIAFCSCIHTVLFLAPMPVLTRYILFYFIPDAGPQ
jgi:hypothetical protein